MLQYYSRWVDVSHACDSLLLGRASPHEPSGGFSSGHCRRICLRRLRRVYAVRLSDPAHYGRLYREHRPRQQTQRIHLLADLCHRHGDRFLDGRCDHGDHGRPDRAYLEQWLGTAGPGELLHPACIVATQSHTDSGSADHPRSGPAPERSARGAAGRRRFRFSGRPLHSAGPRGDGDADRRPGARRFDAVSRFSARPRCLLTVWDSAAWPSSAARSAESCGICRAPAPGSTRSRRSLRYC